MSNKKKIKDTKLGIWLKEKAPDILGIVGDLLPDSGALGVVKNLLDKDDSVDPEEAQRMIDAEVLFQGNVTERWKADMSSDIKLNCSNGYFFRGNGCRQYRYMGF